MASQGRRRRLEIGWLEAAVLTVGYLASLALVYVLGIYVGKGVQQRRLGAEERLIRLPIPEGSGPGGTARSGQEPDLTFYDTLAKGAAAPPARTPRGEGRIIVTEDAELTRARLLLIGTVQRVIRLGLDLLGVRAPERM